MKFSMLLPQLKLISTEFNLRLNRPNELSLAYQILLDGIYLN